MGDCLNKPIQIPVGSNGKSVFIAYATSSAGTDASFTPSSARDYISFVTKTSTASLSDFTVWTLYQGNNGTNGIDGTGISNVYVSNGVTAIGGTIYTENTLVVLMTTGTYINAGIIQTSLTWLTLTMVNGWVSGVGVNVAQYAKKDGFLYFRGTIIATAATDATFASIGTTVTTTVSSTIANTVIPAAVHPFDVTNATDLRVRTYGTSTWLLDSVVPISYR